MSDEKLVTICVKCHHCLIDPSMLIRHTLDKPLPHRCKAPKLMPLSFVTGLGISEYCSVVNLDGKCPEYKPKEGEN